MEKPEKAFEPVETANKLIIETAEEEKTEPMSEDSEIEPVVKKQRKSDDFTSIMIELEFMNKNQIKRSKIILDLINQSETVTIESNDRRVFYLQNHLTYFVRVSKDLSCGYLNSFMVSRGRQESTLIIICKRFFKV